MDPEIDLSTADRDVLIAIIARQEAIIARQQAVIERLEQRIAQLEGRAKPSGARGMPGVKPEASRKPAQPKAPRQRRPHGFARNCSDLVGELVQRGSGMACARGCGYVTDLTHRLQKLLSLKHE